MQRGAQPAARSALRKCGTHLGGAPPRRGGSGDGGAPIAKGRGAESCRGAPARPPRGGAKRQQLSGHGEGAAIQLLSVSPTTRTLPTTPSQRCPPNVRHVPPLPETPTHAEPPRHAVCADAKSP